MGLSKTGLIIGYHGCDKSVRDELVANNLSFKKSENGYDWLGHGMYFWENDAERALEFATFKKEHPQKGRKNIENPSVVATIINLGFCLDLVNSGSLQLVKFAHSLFIQKITANDSEPLKNKPLKGGHDLIFRHLDCAVVETLHTYRHENHLQPFDSVRGVFWEGEDLYENAGFKEKNHIQICIRNSSCVEGFFIPDMRE
jgi:hypothetical protein